MNESFKVVIVDDEPPARDVLEVFVERTPGLHCVATCANAYQALDAIQRLAPQLVFLDIHMPEVTGMELLKLIQANRPEIVLTTAYTQYALTSYEFGVLDYMLKPIAYERFMQAVARFRERQYRLESGAGWTTIDPASSVGGSLVSHHAEADSIWLREEKRLLQIPYEEILYVEGMKDYVKVFLNDQMILTHMTIGKAEALFKPPLFIRIHRSHIVRRAAIRLIDGNTVRLISGVELLIGPLYREELKKYITALR